LNKKELICLFSVVCSGKRLSLGCVGRKAPAFHIDKQKCKAEPYCQPDVDKAYTIKFNKKWKRQLQLMHLLKQFIS